MKEAFLPEYKIKLKKIWIIVYWLWLTASILVLKGR